MCAYLYVITCLQKKTALDPPPPHTPGNGTGTAERNICHLQRRFKVGLHALLSRESMKSTLCIQHR